MNTVKMIKNGKYANIAETNVRQAQFEGWSIVVEKQIEPSEPLTVTEEETVKPVRKNRK